MLQSAEEIRAEAERIIETERATYAPGPESEPDAEKISSDEILEYLGRNQDGDADLLARLLTKRFVFDHATGRWYVFHEHHWREDVTGEALQSVSEVVAIYESEYRRQAWLRLKAMKSEDKDAEGVHANNIKVLFKRIQSLQSLKWKKDILVLACSGKDTLGITGQEWDKLNMELACVNGVISLKDGTLRPGEPEDYIKTAAPTAWRGIDEPCPAWERFLTDIFGGNEALIAFFQRLFGYGITGLANLHIFIILWGVGRNGKGTNLETLRRVLGDYTLKTESEILLEQKYGRQAGAPNSAVLSLRGRRIVWASETSDSGKLNAAKVKELVGGDTLNARAVYGKHHVQFEPSHLLLLLTNHKPVVPENDYALWERIFLIPFERSFVENPVAPHEAKKDPYLGDKLKVEASGILAWLVRGCLAWQKEDLNPPEVVRAATDSYRKEEDIIGQFIDQRLIRGAGNKAKAGEAYKAFQSWCEDNGLHPISANRFGKDMKSRFDSYQDRNGVFYVGVGSLA